MSRTIESQLSLNEARERILALADPGEAIEVSLGEALGLILAEPVVADVDDPPFDRAARDGYAVRAEEATVGTLLRVVEPGRTGRSFDSSIEAGEAGRVLAGDSMPPGSDSVVRPSSVRPDPETGPTRVIEVGKAAKVNQGVTLRGAFLSEGTTVMAAGTRIKPAMIPLLASQGCVHPVCYRRVRVSILSLGDQWVRPDEAPTMNRERNAANAAIVALTVRAEAMPHDFQAVSGPRVRPTLERATTAAVVVVLGASSRPLARAWKTLGYEPLFRGITVGAISQARYGVIRDEEGRVINHVFHLPTNPVAASVGFSLLVGPLIARLQGDASEPVRSLVALADGQSQPATRRHTHVGASMTQVTAEGRSVAELIPGPKDDLLAWSRANGLLLFPEHSGPWSGGDLVELIPIGPKL